MSLAALPGNIAQFQFTEEGAAIFAGIFGRSSASVEARVSEVDQFGVWIHAGDEQVMLVKWTYIVTVVTKYLAPMESVSSRPRIGFQ